LFHFNGEKSRNGSGKKNESDGELWGTTRDRRLNDHLNFMIEFAWAGRTGIVPFFSHERTMGFRIENVLGYV
jgi:hypothetical protein